MLHLFRSAKSLMYPVLVLCACAAHRPVAEAPFHAEPPQPAFPRVQQNPGAFTGSPVIWGGRIDEVIEKLDRSELMLTEVPLTEDTTPLSTRYSEGKFIAKSARLFDTTLYKIGQFVIVCGFVAGVSARPLGQALYAYPLVKLSRVLFYSREFPELPFRCREYSAQPAQQREQILRGDSTEVACDDQGKYGRRTGVDSLFETDTQ